MKRRLLKYCRRTQEERGHLDRALPRPLRTNCRWFHRFSHTCLSENWNLTTGWHSFPHPNPYRSSSSSLPFGGVKLWDLKVEATHTAPSLTTHRPSGFQNPAMWRCLIVDRGVCLNFQMPLGHVWRNIPIPGGKAVEVPGCGYSPSAPPGILQLIDFLGWAPITPSGPQPAVSSRSKCPCLLQGELTDSDSMTLFSCVASVQASLLVASPFPSPTPGSILHLMFRAPLLDCLSF